MVSPAKAHAITYYVDPDSDTTCNGKGTDITVETGTEILTNGDLENWTDATTLSNWSKYQAAPTSTLNREASIIYSGTYSARLDVDSSGNNIFIYQNSVIETGKTYRLQFYAKGSAAFAIATGYRGASFHLIGSPSLTTEWVQQQLTFTATENGRLEIGRSSGQGNGQSIYLDQVSLKEITNSCAWKNISNITGLQAGDTVKFRKGGVWREKITPSWSGTSGTPITFESYGSGNKPVLTRMQNYSHGGTYTWSNSGTGDSSIYKLTGQITQPLLAPWGATIHTEFNQLSNGGYETWTGGVPNNWTSTAQGSSTLSDETSSVYVGSHSLRMTVDGSNSDVGVKQTLSLSPGTTYVLRIVHKETGTAQLSTQIKRTNGTVLYFKEDGSGWQESQAGRALPHKDSYYDSWVYFTTPSSVVDGINDSFEFTLSRNNDASSTSQSLYLDQAVVMVKKELNNNFFLGVASNTDWGTNGMQSISNAPMGTYYHANTLQPGQWFWEDNVMYYRLNTGETIDNIHIEIAQGDWNTSQVEGVTIDNKNYLTFRDLEVSYFPKYSFDIYGTSNHLRFENIYAHHSDMSYVNGADTSYNTFQYSIGTQTHEHVWYDMGSDNNQYFNNIAYETETDTGFGFYAVVTNATFKNNIASQADAEEFNMATGTGITVSNNLWYGSVASVWPSGDGDIANQDPLFADPDNGDFSLLPTSPAINAGVDISLTSDYAGNSVPQGSAPDIGVNEFLTPSSAPSSLAQYASDGTTTVSTGNGVDSTSAVLKFSMTSGNSADSLTPQVEVREVGTAFSDTVTHSGDAVAYSGSSVTGYVTVSGLSLGKRYHWQARISNPAGQSSWVSYGGNSESATDFYTDTSNPTAPSLSSPTGNTKDATKPMLVFKKSTDSGSGISSYTVTLDAGKNKSYSTSGIPASGNGSASYTWKDDNYVKIEFLNENDSDSSNDEIRVYFKGLNNNELTEGKHTWTVTAYDPASNSTSQSADINLDRTSPTVSELAIADVSTVTSGVTYNLSNTNRMPSFSGLATDIYQGSTVTNSNGTKDTFDKVSSGPKTITLTMKRLDGKEYKDHLTKDFSLSDITNLDNDKKFTRFFVTTPFPLIDGKYKVQLTLEDDAGNTYQQPDFYLSLNSGKTSLASTLLTGQNLETEIIEQETTPTETEEEKQVVQENGYEVKIKVVDKEKNPVKGAKVTIHSKVQETTTDENGIAQFSNVEPGDHRVLIAYDNYKGEQEISLTGDVKEFSLTIQVEEASPFSTNLERIVLGVLGITIFSLAVFVYKSKKSRK